MLSHERLVTVGEDLLTRGVRGGISRFLGLTAAALLALTVVPPAQAAPGSLGAAKQKAAALQARIEAQGERLSAADEAYNVAANQRRSLDADLSKTRVTSARAEKRYGELRDRLDRRVRILYMHPGAPLNAWLSMRSLTEDARQRVLSNSVLTADSSLVSETDRARREVRAEAGRLAGLRADAQRSESSLAEQRGRVSGELATQRALLSSVKGDIARIIEADRKAKLAEAARLAAASGPRPAGGGSPASGSPVKVNEANIPPPPAPSPGAAKAVSVASDQIGKPYEWAAAGPDKFDCSGLTMYAWAAGGVQMPHSAAAQLEMFPKVARASLQPGDLVFFGSPIHHVGIYEGGGIMIDAPQTGENVRRDSIDRADYAGSARP
jgi:cell wall-associated NlpC family hydrolase